MPLNAILSAIDNEISKLQQVRALLVDADAPIVKRRGRPKKAAALPAVKTVTKRILSTEARARIASAQKKRWAAKKQTK